MKGTVTAYDATRAIATVKLETGEEVAMHAVAYLDPRLPAVGDEIICEVTSAKNWVTVARRANQEPVKEMIEVAHCVHCGGITLAPKSDTCSCGAELYPVTKMVPLDEAIPVDGLKAG